MFPLLPLTFKLKIVLPSCCAGRFRILNTCDLKIFFLIFLNEYYLIKTIKLNYNNYWNKILIIPKKNIQNSFQLKVFLFKNKLFNIRILNNFLEINVLYF